LATSASATVSAVVPDAPKAAVPAEETVSERERVH
jgi:hypothetical protein